MEFDGNSSIRKRSVPPDGWVGIRTVLSGSSTGRQAVLVDEPERTVRIPTQPSGGTDRLRMDELPPDSVS